MDEDTIMHDAPPGVEDVRHHPIEVVLPPPQHPADYEIIPRSNVVARVVDKVVDLVEEVNGEFYTIELTSGHVDQVEKDFLLELENGPAAFTAFRKTQKSIMKRMAASRVSDEDEPPPDADFTLGRQRKKARFSEPEPSESSKEPKRRSMRRASQQASQQIATDYERTSGDKVTTRAWNLSYRQRHAQGDSEDELAQDPEYYDTLPDIRSDINGAAGMASRKRRRQKRSSYSGSYVDADSDIEFEPARRSQRVNKSTKNMRELDINVEQEQSIERAPTAPKFAAIKETFEELPEDDEFRRWHSQECSTCGSGVDHSKGPLISCQGCSHSYHQACLGPRSQRDHRATKVGPNTFVLQCKYCLGIHRKNDSDAPNHSLCQSCKTPGLSCAQFSIKKSAAMEENIRILNGGEDPITPVPPHLINNATNVLFRCSTCYRAYHFEHLPRVSMYPDGIDIREQHLDDYSRDDFDWSCKECAGADEDVHALVAWRPVDESLYNAPISEPHDRSPDNREYLVKWHNRSHFHDTWMSGAWVYGVTKAAMRNAFHRREDNELPKMDTESAIEPEWLLADVLLRVSYNQYFVPTSKEHDLDCISDIVEVQVKFQGLGYDEVVWDQPPPRDSGAPWDAFCDAYRDFLEGWYFPKLDDKRMRDRISEYRSLDFKNDCELKSQPPSLKSGRTLMEYQLEGVNWLLLNFHQQQNVILADEMGLGKTIQIVSFISSLVQDQPKCWPFLIVVPNATCPNWRRELKDWAPGLRVVAYHGGKRSQELAYEWELFHHGVRDGMKAHVVIMSYEAAAAVKTEFRAVKWAGLIVDEGQRLKNEDTQLYQRLKDMNIPFRVLLTGTPLQNNKRELFNLLQFIDPKNNAQELDKKYEELTQANLPELHNLIRPYFLRRTKLEVLKFLPPMSQVILPVSMTILQETLCKSIIARNPELIKAILSNSRMRASDRKNLVNIMADLRQCLCHPFCFNASIEDQNVGYAQMQRNLIEASPKLMLLEVMLPKLKERGHRVLIFSQFLRCLDILEDFLNLLGLQYGRIDGKMSALKKQKQIDAFNADDSPLFAMLLTTRAGGVGINLASADTVIIYDPDWNPHQDIQAISRAHRIGQKEKVLCFQLTTKDTVEENILQTGKKKLALDQALIERLDADEENEGDIESVLKRGAEALFSGQEQAKIVYDAASVDKLLDRSRVEPEEAGASNALFRVWSNDTGTITDGVANDDDNNAPSADADVWAAILRTREENHLQERARTQVEYGRGARRRGKQAVDYSASNLTYIAGVNDVDDSDEDMTEAQDQELDSAGSSVNVDDDTDGDYNVENMDVEEQAPAKAAEPSRALEPAKANNPKQRRKARQSVAMAPDTAVGVNQRVKSNQSAPQTQILPPHNPLLLNSPIHLLFRPNALLKDIPSRNMNPNFVVPVPVPSQTATAPANGGHRNGALSSGPTSPLGEGGICLICKGRHPPNYSCVNFGSEISLRLAIDSLRASPIQPNMQAYRDLLLRQLRQLTGR
ncbi:PHD/FYVE-zinc-finger like domain-containing protein [Hypoxylon cercidicola]|nr:PHD/FYVE-zinc-finger like domain-containing protein [Hypoxylon cercidicola]